MYLVLAKVVGGVPVHSENLAVVPSSNGVSAVVKPVAVGVVTSKDGAMVASDDDPIEGEGVDWTVVATEGEGVDGIVVDTEGEGVDSTVIDTEGESVEGTKMDTEGEGVDGRSAVGSGADVDRELVGPVVARNEGDGVGLSVVSQTHGRCVKCSLYSHTNHSKTRQHPSHPDPSFATQTDSVFLWLTISSLKSSKRMHACRGSSFRGVEIIF